MVRTLAEVVSHLHTVTDAAATDEGQDMFVKGMDMDLETFAALSIILSDALDVEWHRVGLLLQMGWSLSLPPK